MKNNCIYFVEGECEEKLLAALKESPPKIQPGRIKVVNPVQARFSKSQLLTIQPGTTVVLVFDTDVKETACLLENIKLLRKYCTKVKIIYLPQVENLEDELVRCADIKHVTELTRSKSSANFKRDFCAMKNIRAALDKAGLNTAALWTKMPSAEFAFIERNSGEIKL